MMSGQRHSLDSLANKIKLGVQNTDDQRPQSGSESVIEISIAATNDIIASASQPSNSRDWHARLEDGYHPHDTHEHYPPKDRGTSWHKRPRSPGLKWYKNKFTESNPVCGRVLVIDYVKSGT